MSHELVRGKAKGCLFLGLLVRLQRASHPVARLVLFLPAGDIIQYAQTEEGFDQNGLLSVQLHAQITNFLFLRS